MSRSSRLWRRSRHAFNPPRPHIQCTPTCQHDSHQADLQPLGAGDDWPRELLGSYPVHELTLPAGWQDAVTAELTSLLEAANMGPTRRTLPRSPVIPRPHRWLRIRQVPGVIDDGRPSTPWLFSIIEANSTQILSCKSAATQDEALARGCAQLEEMSL